MVLTLIPQQPLVVDTTAENRLGALLRPRKLWYPIWLTRVPLTDLSARPMPLTQFG
jgi:hypothetical protein